MSMLSVQEARERILETVQPVGETKVRLDQASHRVLSRDITARNDYPPFTNSAMDGYAICSSDTASSLPVALHVVDDIPAGRAITPKALRISPGMAARIMTGAPLPEGADAVIPLEDTDILEPEPGNPAPPKITVSRRVNTEENIRYSGSDIRSGQTVLKAHTRLRPQEIGILAMLGLGDIPVFDTPVIALLSSGDELLPVESPLSPGKIHDSNTPMLTAQIEEAGGRVVRLGIAGDNRNAVKHMLEKAASSSVNMIISSAGVSVGAFDFIKEAVLSDGSMNFWRVNMRPGKPLAYGEYRGIPFAGLPGNPVSAFVAFEVFIRNAIEKMAGSEPRPRQRITMKLAEDITSDGRESYLRAIVNKDGSVRLTGHQGSGNLLSLVEANALLIIPAGVKSRPAGQEVEAWLV